MKYSNKYNPLRDSTKGNKNYESEKTYNTVTKNVEHEEVVPKYKIKSMHGLS
jgi:hypothetical protein